MKTSCEGLRVSSVGFHGFLSRFQVLSIREGVIGVAENY